MKIGKIKYQSVLFGDFRGITPSSERVITLLELFKEKNFIPSTFMELDPFSPTPINRIALSSENSEWQMNFGSPRIDIIHNSLNLNGDNLGTINSFVQEVLDLIGLFQSRFDKKGNRISLLAEAFIDDENKNNFDNLYNKVRKPFGVYSKNVPLEWSIRDLIRKDIHNDRYKETFNIISSLGRLQGQTSFNNEITRIDRINFILDINTIPEITDHRFDIEYVKWGLNEMIGIYSSLMTDIQEWIKQG
jgi:hypothetical protein